MEDDKNILKNAPIETTPEPQSQQSHMIADYIDRVIQTQGSKPGHIPIVDSLDGLPGALPDIWCLHCKENVTPEGKGTCPKCGRFLRRNFLARKKPVNLVRKEFLLRKFIADYQPSTTLLHSSCEMLAGIVEQLETMKPGSAEHQRLIQLSQQLGASLEESRVRESQVSSDATAVLTDEQIEARLVKLLEMLRSTRLPKMSEAQHEGAVHGAIGDREDAEQDAEQDAARVEAYTLIPKPDRRSDATADRGVDASTPSTPPVPPAPCEYCHQSPCVGRDHTAYDALHDHDPGTSSNAAVRGGDV